jgi:hypothetical protein
VSNSYYLTQIMKYRLSILLILVFGLFSCSKSDEVTNVGNSLVGVYTLVKTGQVELTTKKITEDSEKITGELTLISDNSYRIVFNLDGKSKVETGTYDAKKMKFDNEYDLYFEGKYLVLVTEYNDEYNDVAYFLKK